MKRLRVPLTCRALSKVSVGTQTPLGRPDVKLPYTTIPGSRFQASLLDYFHVTSDNLRMVLRGGTSFRAVSKRFSAAGEYSGSRR